MGLSPRPAVFDESIEEPSDQLWEGNHVLVASAAVLFKEGVEQGLRNAVGKECECGFSQWQTVEDLTGEFGWLGGVCPRGDDGVAES